MGRILTLTIALVLLGCDKDQCEFEASSAIIGEIELHAVDYEGYNEISLLAQHNQIAHNKYALWLEVTPEFIAEFGSDGGTSISCDMGQIPLAVEIESISFRTLKAYNEAYLSGADMTDRFVFMTKEGSRSLSDVQMNEDFVNSYYLFFKCEEIPEPNNLVSFEVTLKMKNGAGYVLESVPVFISN
ncbi:MAG: hypothetical protein JXQ90_14980 [Cyclobacteriaceae bacterium]